MPDAQINTNFRVTPEGLVVFKSTRVALARPTEVIVLASARNGFGLDDHTMFDAILNGYPQPKRYIVRFEDEFNWAARFAEFQAGTPPKGVDFTPAELGAVAALKSAQNKIKAAYGLPEIPYEQAAAIDVKAIYGSNADAALAWLNGGQTNRYLADIAGRNSANQNLLRVRATATSAYIDTLSGYKVGEKTVRKMWPKVKALWADPSKINESYGNNVSRNGLVGYDVYVYRNYVKVGCQYVPRAELERIAALRGWDNPVAA